MNLLQRLFVKYYMTPKRFSRYLIKSDESRAYGRVAEIAYGINLGQFNLLPKAQLDRLIGLLYPSDYVLDIGCGNGRQTNHIAQKSRCTIKGIDFAADAINRANRRYANATTSFEIRNINELGTMSERFSKIIAIDSLYFFPDLKPILATLINLLRENGMIILFYTYNRNLHHDISIDLVDAALTGSKITVEKYDYTAEEITFWKILQRELEVQRDDFKKEGNADLYKLRCKEASTFVKMGAQNGLKRMMYLITP